MPRHRKFRGSSRSSRVSSQSRKWYVYWPKGREILGGYASREKAEAEAERAGRELNDFVMVLSRESRAVRYYAMMHPEFARREGFKVQPHVYEPMRR
jgi:hypothetical protein